MRNPLWQSLRVNSLNQTRIFCLCKCKISICTSKLWMEKAIEETIAGEFETIFNFTLDFTSQMTNIFPSLAWVIAFSGPAKASRAAFKAHGYYFCGTYAPDGKGKRWRKFVWEREREREAETTKYWEWEWMQSLFMKNKVHCNLKHFLYWNNSFKWHQMDL